MQRRERDRVLWLRAAAPKPAEILQGIEAPFPFEALCRKPILCGLERLRHECVGAHAPFVRAHEPTILQHAEALHKGGQRHLERLRQCADRGWTARQALKHGLAGGDG